MYNLLIRLSDIEVSLGDFILHKKEFLPWTKYQIFLLKNVGN